MSDVQPIKRGAYYGLIHAGFERKINSTSASQLTKDEIDMQYRNWLENRTGERSCVPLTDGQLKCLLSELKSGGWVKDSSDYRPGGTGPGRPSDQQWRKLAALANSRGWKGLDSPSLNAFVQRTARVGGTRFLTAKTITQVITGLEKWLKPPEAEK